MNRSVSRVAPAGVEAPLTTSTAGVRRRPERRPWASLRRAAGLRHGAAQEAARMATGNQEPAEHGLRSKQHGVRRPRDWATRARPSEPRRGQCRVVDPPAYRLEIAGRVDRPVSLTVTSSSRPTTPCYPSRAWRDEAFGAVAGRNRDRLALAGAVTDRMVLVESLKPRGAYRTSTLNSGQASDRDSLLATHHYGEPLTRDYGVPCRLMAPNRSGVLQTKWASRVVDLRSRRPSQPAAGEPVPRSESRPQRAGPSWRSACRAILQHSVDTRPDDVARFVVGGALLHDLVLAALVIIAGVLVGPYRCRVRPWFRRPRSAYSSA